LIHGGMLAAFLAGLLAAAAARPAGATPVTVHLSIDFLDMGRAGEWVLGEARVTRLARDIAFVEGRAHIAGRDLARASGVFKLMHRRSR
jgi:acyl-coenzyme A thioesterase PaaI-like protein